MSTHAIGDLIKQTPPTDIRELRDRCSNCAGFLPLRGQEDELCLTCQRITEADAQIWECSPCRTLRMWGFNRPYETSSKHLGCSHCGTVTQHRFAYVARRVMESIGGKLAERQREMKTRHAHV